MNKPASLTAGVCSLCITASLVVAPPHAAAGQAPVVQHRSVSVLENPYALTASSQALQNLLLVAGIPFNNLNTTLSTLGGLTNFVTGLNLALGNIYKGNWDQVPANLAKAWTDEVAAFKKVLALPQTLIKYDAAVIGNFLGGLGAGATLASSNKSVSTAAAALPTAQSAAGLLGILSLPFYNVNTTLSTLGGLTNFVTGLNLALGNLYKGNWDQIPANLQKAWTDEVAAFKKVLALPQTLIKYNLAVIGNAFNPASATATTFVQSERVSTLALPTAKTSIEAGTPTSADEVTGTKKDTKDSTETKDATEVKDSTETKDTTTEVKDTTETKTPTETKDTTTEVKDTTETKTPTETKDTTTEVKDTTETKTGEKDAKDTTTGKTTTGKKGSTYGKHARQDDGTDSTVSASTGTKSSTGGKHRKTEAGSSEGSSASSAGEHSSAA